MVVIDFNLSLHFGQSTLALPLKGSADAHRTHHFLTTAGLSAQISIRPVRASLPRQSSNTDFLMFRPVSLHDVCTDVKKELKLKQSLGEILQILSIVLFEQVPIGQVLMNNKSQNEINHFHNQLSLFNL
jgi:hypothetical protein